MTCPQECRMKACPIYSHPPPPPVNAFIKPNVHTSNVRRALVWQESSPSGKYVRALAHDSECEIIVQNHGSMIPFPHILCRTKTKRSEISQMTIRLLKIAI